MKALALFSGGLDSSLAIKLIQNQGIEVIALNFVSHFFGGEDEKMKKMGEQLGIQVEYIDFIEEQRKIVENPPSGYGKNMNPCIDCHALMLRTAAKLFDKYEANFVITGEILGQRPMSQNLIALNKVEQLSGIPGLVVRPMSAKHLEPTIPEKEGWIDREKLLGITGRSRKPQMKLAEEFGIVDYPAPAGGCLLTDPHYSRRLRMLKDDEIFDRGYLFELLKCGRFFRLEKGKYLFVGRHAGDNANISKYKDKADLYIIGDKTPGPDIVGIGNYTDDDISFAKNIFARYSKSKGQEISRVLVNGKSEEVSIIDRNKIDEEIKKYLVL